MSKVNSTSFIYIYSYVYTDERGAETQGGTHE